MTTRKKCSDLLQWQLMAALGSAYHLLNVGFKQLVVGLFTLCLRFCNLRSIALCKLRAVRRRSWLPRWPKKAFAWPSCNHGPWLDIFDALCEHSILMGFGLWQLKLNDNHHPPSSSRKLWDDWRVSFVQHVSNTESKGVTMPLLG